MVTDDNSSCARNSIVHDVMVEREADRTVIMPMNSDIENTQIEITDLLEPSQNYRIHVRSHGMCKTGEATIVCRTSDNLSPITAPSATGLCSQIIYHSVMIVGLWVCVL